MYLPVTTTLLFILHILKNDDDSYVQYHYMVFKVVFKFVHENKYYNIVHSLDSFKQKLNFNFLTHVSVFELFMYVYSYCNALLARFSL